ncbi:MAG: hypothetical protein NT129_00120 [Candidatus Aenigmarchaeota archaeon]|nr:hypothetical protein [Candidatus Aenigmarchaeota archaeon]
MRVFFLIAVVIVLFISGCIEFPTNPEPFIKGGLKISLLADPSTVFSGSDTMLYVDVENTETKTLNNVSIGVYYLDLFQADKGYEIAKALFPDGCKANSGTCSSSPCAPGMDIGRCDGKIGPIDPACPEPYCCGYYCSKQKDELKPGDMMTHACKLKAPSKEDMAGESLTGGAGVKITYDTELSAVQLVELITEDGYLIRKNTGDWSTKPKSYTYRDKGIEMQVEFSDELPIVVRKDKKAYVYFSIKNIGGGFISDIVGGNIYDTENHISYKLDGFSIPIDYRGDFSYGDFSIEQTKINNKFIMTCSNINKLSQNNDEFPRIACELNLPQNMDYLSNYPVTIKVHYDYEIRKDVPIKIVR